MMYVKAERGKFFIQQFYVQNHFLYVYMRRSLYEFQKKEFDKINKRAYTIILLKLLLEFDMIKVLSVGGSIVAPDVPDTQFLIDFEGLIRTWLAEDASRKIILVVGGGGPARTYQKAYRTVKGYGKPESEQSESTVHFSNEQADWIGILATRLNAQLLRAVFADICNIDVVYDPTSANEFTGRVMIAAGWKPGFSTDNDAVLLAERFGAMTVVNLSNIAKVYTDDPRKNSDAKPIDTISWADFRKMVGDEWVPGKNVPFDPIASRRAEKAGITVICAAGRNIENIRAILNEKPFEGTKIA